MMSMRALLKLLPTIWMGCFAGVALADEARAPSGVFHSRMTPCLLAKYNGGRPCEAPMVSAHSGKAEQVASREARAHFFADMEQLPLALIEAEEALKLDQQNADVRHLVARLALSTGDILRGESELKKALELRPNDPNIRATRAGFLESQGAAREAVREYSKVLAIDPAHRFSRTARAKLYLALGDMRPAIVDLDALIAQDRDENLLALRGGAHLALEEPAKAIRDFNESLEVSPNRIDLIIGRANALEVLGDDEAALRDYDSVLGPIGGKPNYAVAGEDLGKLQFQRALVLGRLKRYAGAAADAMNALHAGGARSILRTQAFLRQNGFPETPLDGKASDALKASLQACFGLNSCFVKLSDTL